MLLFLRILWKISPTLLVFLMGGFTGWKAHEFTSKSIFGFLSQSNEFLVAKASPAPPKKGSRGSDYNPN